MENEIQKVDSPCIYYRIYKIFVIDNMVSTLLFAQNTIILYIMKKKNKWSVFFCGFNLLFFQLA